MTDIKELTEKAARLLDRCRVVTLAIEIEGSFPKPQVFAKLHSNDFDKLILSSDDSVLRSLPSSGKAKLTYTDGHDIVTLVGEPEVIRDFETDSSSPHTVLLKFRSEEAAISIDGDCVFIDTSAKYLSKMRASRNLQPA